MGMWKAGAVAVFGILLAAGCTDRGQGQRDQKAVAPTVVEVPKRKPGLWKQTLLVEGVDVIQTVELCLDEASDSKLAWWGQQGFKQACSKNEISRQPDGSWTFSSVCSGGGVKTTNDGVAVGNFEKRYQIKAESSTTGAPVPQMNGTRTITIDAEWTGECPADMKPGDMEMPNGQRINMLEVSGQQ